MILIIGGAYQGKLDYAVKLVGCDREAFVDGAVCNMEDMAVAKGIFHFHEYVRRRLQQDKTLEGCILAKEIIENNPNLVVVSNELGYGIVPVDKFDRLWRETTGRVCTELAVYAQEVHRVVCGLGMILKKREME